ncbi:MAG: signal peptidase II [Verrucomicrobiota bacterium]
MASGLRPYLTFWTVGFAALAADVGTKLLLVRRFPIRFENDWVYNLSADPERSPIEVSPWFWIVHVGNKGAAWGLGSQQDVRPYLVLLALVVLYLVWRWRRSLLVELSGGQVAFGLFVGGTLGNVRDRVFGDHVIDFFDVHLPGGYRFPAFNVADACICVGVGLYLILSYRQEAARKEAIASHSGDDLAGRP